jgi:hypothetical protein
MASTIAPTPPNGRLITAAAVAVLVVLLQGLLQLKKRETTLRRNR